MVAEEDSSGAGGQSSTSSSSETNHLESQVTAFHSSFVLDSDNQQQHVPPQFRNMKIGKILGAGRFNVVREVTILPDENQNRTSQNTNSPSNERYVVKSLLRNNFRGGRQDDKDQLEAASIDLRVEADLLSRISGQHTNIIQLHGVCTETVAEEQEQYYLILDRLETTLQENLFLWRCRHATLGSLSSSFRKSLTLRRRWSGELSVTPLASSPASSSLPSRIPELSVRLGMAADIASAFSFLHSRGIMHRDLKPDNVGLDANGRIKIFDFGLAREYHRNGKMTGLVGTRRYMAPEIAKRAKHYDLSVDVYSFGILLWEMCALEKPLAKYCSSAKRLERKVHYEGRRPETHCFRGWTAELKTLLHNCWADSSAQRPTFGEIVQELQSEAVLASSDDERSLSSGRRTWRLQRLVSSVRFTSPGSIRSMSVWGGGGGGEGPIKSHCDNDNDSDAESIATFAAFVSR